MPNDHLLALISATPLAIPPATEALLEELPEARIWNLLDDRLLQDAADAGGLTDSLASRMRGLIEHAVGGGADAILLTCSMYGQVAQQSPLPIPVLAPDEAAFAEVLNSGYPSVLVVASLDSALADSMQRLSAAASDAGSKVEVRGLAVPTAKEAAATDDPSLLSQVLIQACRPHLQDVAAVMLAQYSLAPARADMQDALGLPVISGPASAAVTLRNRLTTPQAGATLGAIADDYTGGTDVALAFRQAGLRSLLFFGPPDASTALPPHDAIVIALKTRTAPPAEAVADSLSAWTWLSARNVGTVYVKYCSTFDSTPRGNIGPVVDALAEAVGAATVVTTPSSPEHERTVYCGQLFVGGVPLAQTHMAHHPLTPMTDSDLPRLLAAQTDQPVEHLPLSTVRAGVAQVRSTLLSAASRGVRHLIADALDESDLRTLAVAVADQPLVAGAAGLAGAVAAAWGGPSHLDPTAADPVGEAPAAVVAGSCSARTLEQIADFERRGNPTYRLDPLKSPNPDTLAQKALGWVDDLPSGATPLIYTSLPSDDLHQVQQKLGTTTAAELLEAALARVVRGLVSRGVRRLVSAGGETSGAIVRALSVKGATLGGDVSPGVPWIYTLDERPLALLLKSGNFGDVAIFTRATDPDQAWGVQS